MHRFTQRTTVVMKRSAMSDIISFLNVALSWKTKRISFGYYRLVDEKRFIDRLVLSLRNAQKQFVNEQI
jgi:hypothetical protein